MPGFFDLNVVVDNDAAFGPVHQVLIYSEYWPCCHIQILPIQAQLHHFAYFQANMSNFLIKLGYDCVAYNFVATAPLEKKHRFEVSVFYQECSWFILCGIPRSVTNLE